MPIVVPNFEATYSEKEPEYEMSEPQSEVQMKHTLSGAT